MADVRFVARYIEISHFSYALCMWVRVLVSMTVKVRDWLTNSIGENFPFCVLVYTFCRPYLPAFMRSYMMMVTMKMYVGCGQEVHVVTISFGSLPANALRARLSLPFKIDAGAVTSSSSSSLFAAKVREGNLDLPKDITRWLHVESVSVLRRAGRSI